MPRVPLRSRPIAASLPEDEEAPVSAVARRPPPVPAVARLAPCAQLFARLFAAGAPWTREPRARAAGDADALRKTLPPARRPPDRDDATDPASDDASDLGGTQTSAWSGWDPNLSRGPTGTIQRGPNGTQTSAWSGCVQNTSAPR